MWPLIDWLRTYRSPFGPKRKLFGAKTLTPIQVATVAATELAVRHLGRSTPNTVLPGALTALTEVIHLDSVFKAIRDKFSGEIAERNIAAAQAAHDQARPA